jgi:replicative DNA helicase
MNLLLPHDSESERVIAASVILQGTKALDELFRTRIDFPDFYDERYRLIIKAAVELAKKNEAIDTITMQSALNETEIGKKIGIPQTEYRRIRQTS